MMRILVVVFFALFLVACSQQAPTCTAPYVLHGDTCCLDRDANSVCDIDENSSLHDNTNTAIDCSLCPPKFVTEREEIVVYKYVCMNGSIVNEEDGCEERIVSNAHLFNVNTKQNDATVNKFDSRVACRGRYLAAEVHIDPVKDPLNITIQVMDTPNTVYRDLHVIQGTQTILDDVYFYIGFCEDDIDCEAVTDMQLPPTGAYLVRATWKSVDSPKVVTRDRLIDPTPEGAYGQNVC